MTLPNLVTLTPLGSEILIFFPPLAVYTPTVPACTNASTSQSLTCLYTTLDYTEQTYITEIIVTGVSGSPQQTIQFTL
jgi:hypothetical protein